MPDLYIELIINTRDGQTIITSHNLHSTTLVTMPVAKLVEELSHHNHENVFSYTLQVNKKE